MLLDQASIQTTEKHFGMRQNLIEVVNDVNDKLEIFNGES